MTDFLHEAECLLRDKRSVEEREISLPAQLAERRRENEELRSLMRRMDTPDPGSTLLPAVQAASSHERRNHSVVKLIQSLLRDPMGKEPSLERDLGHAISQDLKHMPALDGVYVPLQLSPRMSGLDTRTGARGGYNVAQTVENIETYLRAKSVCLRMGATLMSGLSGQVGIPLQTAGSTASWSSENSGSDVSASDSTFGTINLQVKTLTATTSYSRGLLQQSSADVEAFIRADLAAAHAVALDAAAFAGTGVEGQPLGLLNESGVPVITLGADGDAPSGKALADMERTVADASADLGMLGWATTPLMRYLLRQTPVFTNSSIPCWQCDEGLDQCLGSPAVVSKSIPQTLVKGNNSDCHAIIVGYWPALAFASWGVLALTVDPYAQVKKGMVEVTSHALVDIVIRRPTAFAVVADARSV